MNPMDRLWSLAAALLALSIAAGTWFGVIAPDLQAAATADSDRENVEMQNAIHETRIQALEQEAERIDEFRAERDELAKGVPDGVEYAAFVRQLDALAAQSGITITAITTSEPVHYLPAFEEPVQEAPAETDGTADESSTDTADEAAEAPPEVPASTDAPAAPLPYANPLIGPENLAAIQFSVSAEGSAAGLTDFLNRLQTGERLISVTTANLTDEAVGDVSLPDETIGDGSLPEAPVGIETTGMPGQLVVDGFLWAMPAEVVAP